MGIELLNHRNETKYFMTAFFSLFIFMGIFNSFNARTTRLNLLASISKNKVFLLVISFILLLFGATETYYGVLPFSVKKLLSYYDR